jgi:hypothetical protein
VEQYTKRVADQINKSLDELGAPLSSRERSSILSKILHIPRQQAWSLLEGHLIPEKDLQQKIITELEIDPKLFNKQ